VGDDVGRFLARMQHHHIDTASPGLCSHGINFELNVNLTDVSDCPPGSLGNVMECSTLYRIPEIQAATHRCLLFPEIFDAICAEINSQSNLRGERSLLLVTLAQTCRSFQALALDHLWCDIDNIVPLIKCMPTDLWQGGTEAEPLVCRCLSIGPTGSELKNADTVRFC
jgi:hypothetical protein